MRCPRYFVLYLLFVGSSCLSQCTPDGATRLNRDVGETHLHCDSSSDANGATIQWSITNPDATKQLIEYRDITFSPGDQVLVSARGCVDVARNTDDHDWRRYVDPVGSGTDRHFHGLIWIPGASVRDNSQLLYTAAGTGPVRISSVSGSKDDPANVELLTIQPAPAGTLPTLRLGYEVDYDRTGTNPRPVAAHLQANAARMLPKALDEQAPKELPRGASGQCKGEPLVASITINIKRPTQASLPGTQPTSSETRPTRTLLSFDPVSLRTDDNGFMLSPLWYGNLGKHDTSGLEVVDDCKNFEYKHWLFVRYGVRSPCTQAVSFDVPPGFITECTFAPGFGQLHGHVNWIPATFEGKLIWQDRSADQDQDLQLRTLSDYDRSQRFAGNHDFGKVGGILTRDSQGISDYKNALWLEFARYETIGPTKKGGDSYLLPDLDDSEKWENFLKESKNKQLTAIVTGLLNLDCVHECHTELHPVLAMAVRMKDETSPNTNADDEWGIFLRNSGNEGDCSTDAHYLSRDSYTFFLPAPKLAPDQVQIPQVNPGTDFTASTEGVTWSISPAPKAEGQGALIRFSFAPHACNKIHKGRDAVRLGGTLKLNWTQNDDWNGRSVSSGTGPNYLVIREGSEEQLKELPCPPDRPEPADRAGSRDPDRAVVLADDLTQSEKESARLHHDNPSCKTLGCLASALGDFFQPRSFGVFPEFLLYNKTSQVQINTGFRYSVVQTSLGSFEVEGAPGLSRSVRSNDGTNLSVRISDFLYGIKLRFPSALNIFGEAKGGILFRSASPGFSSTPDFFRFRGHDSLFLIGGGIEPGKPTRTLGLDVSIRISADYMYLPGTSEHLVRITLGPQFQIPRHATR
jgi:hypothetical protein